jgi:hypothetical protein
LQSYALYDLSADSGHVKIYGQDPGAFSLGIAPFPEIALGELSEARRHASQGIRLAAQVGHPESRAAAYIFGAWTEFQLSNHEQGLMYARTAQKIATEQLLPAFECWGQMIENTMDFDPPMLQRALDLHERLGTKLTIMIHIPNLAAKALEVHDLPLARRLISRPLAMVASEESMPMLSVEALRIAGLIAHAHGDSCGRTAAFGQAWDAAERTGARFFGLRTAADAALCGDTSATWRARTGDLLSGFGTELPAPERQRAQRALS